MSERERERERDSDRETESVARKEKEGKEGRVVGSERHGANQSRLTTNGVIHTHSCVLALLALPWPPSAGVSVSVHT